jgi:hypothetical protein
MSITQTVEVPANHRLTIDVPSEVPTGASIIIQFPVSEGANPAEQKKGRVRGCAKGQFRMSDDFDEPLEDFKVSQVW